MNDIDTLRSVLFETLQALRDKENPMDIERAKAITDVAQVVVNTAKVEIDFRKQASTSTSASFFKPIEDKIPTQTGLKITTQVAGGSITSHRIR